MTGRPASHWHWPIRGGPVSGPAQVPVQSRPGGGQSRTVGRRSVPSGPRRGGDGGLAGRNPESGPHATRGARTPRLLRTALPSGTAETDLGREPILAGGVCCGSLASPPARSWSHFPERKSACSGSGGTCSEEWRRRVRRCAWLNSGAPRPTRLGERGVARGRLVRTTRAPARRCSPPLRGRGMGMGSGAFGGRRCDGGLRVLVKCCRPEGLLRRGSMQRVATGPREAQREPR